MTFSHDRFSRSEPPAPGPPAGSAKARVTIERNGQEYLVTVDGVAYVALTRTQAEEIAKRRSPPGIRPILL